jgi:hypothetical protein
MQPLQEFDMSAIHHFSQRGNGLVTQARQALGSGASHLPTWLEAGAVMAVAKTGLRATTTLARRNPGIAIALGVVGAGLLAYRFYRKRTNGHAAQAGNGALLDGNGRDSDELVVEVIEDVRPKKAGKAKGTSDARAKSRSK